MSELTKQEFDALLGLVARTNSDQISTALQALSARRETLNRLTIHRYRPGMRVSWTGKHGFQRGTVIRAKQKYVEVAADGMGGNWNVPANMLKEETGGQP